MLLESYCRHADTSNWLSKLIEGEKCKPLDLNRLDRLLAMRAREDALFMSVATKLRLTPQARIAPRSAGRAFDDGGPALYERRKPWEYE